jgi:transposase-like protein
MKNVNDIYTKKNKSYTKSNIQDEHHFKPYTILDKHHLNT